MSTPFLLRFARPCNLGKSLLSLDRSRYDESCDMRRAGQGPDADLLIDTPDARGPGTKKADIERGEDQKDRRMWR